MAVPIEDIVKEKMGLTLIKGGRLTDDFSIFGQICFSQGKVKVYDILSGKEHDLDVKRGTILIDAYTYWERNLGCVNNTIAHESYHWFRHRVYAAIKSILKGEKFIACRCPAKGGDEKKSGEWTDEERMEWQANHIAPRILMPIQTARPKIEELLGQYDYYGNGADKTMILECVIDDLAEFYKVSKQSAKIRMVDLGYKEADGVYNFEGFAPYFSSISPRDAFYEYCDNEEFRSVVDSGRFRYVEGYFVINSERFIAKDANGKLVLTEYARDNLDECALQFTYRRVDMRLHGQFHHDAFHRKNPDSYQKLPRYDADKNAALIANAAAFKAAFEEEYETVTAISKTFSQLVTELMERKGWDAHKFAEHTRLDPNNYYRILRGETENPSIETVLNICIGLDAPPQIREELIVLAGRSWQKTQLHCAYQFILKKGNVCTVTDFNNAFALLEIESGGKPPLKDDI
jgi:transcriptional regulator with XRE-family HTH domain